MQLYKSPSFRLLRSELNKERERKLERAESIEHATSKASESTTVTDKKNK